MVKMSSAFGIDNAPAGLNGFRRGSVTSGLHDSKTDLHFCPLSCGINKKPNKVNDKFQFDCPEARQVAARHNQLLLNHGIDWKRTCQT